MASSLGPVGQFAFTVADVPRAVEYYRDALGLPLLFQAPPGLAFFDCGGIRLMLSRPEGEFKPGSSSVLYFRVSDIVGTHRALAGRGVAFIDEPHLIAKMPDHELWMCFFRDPDGNALALMEEKR
ncbi:MAG TPA: VOC family protein [Gemmatimonadaceae bacterium]|nr:VOC family protein [Gemmatimonadaceae bacterium]